LHPPGRATLAFLKLPQSAPKRSYEALILEASSFSTMYVLRQVASILTVVLSNLVTDAPRLESMSSITLTSLMSGTFSRIHSPSTKSVAGIIAIAAFLAPEI
jgi:hypothetical protein